MRAFPVQMPSGMRYWTVIDEELRVMPVADAYLRHVRFGRDGAESTTKTYAVAVALYLSWCAATGQGWRVAAERMPSFVLWLRHAPAQPGTPAGGVGAAALRGARRINCVLAGVRGFLSFAVDQADAPRSVQRLEPVAVRPADEVPGHRPPAVRVWPVCGQQGQLGRVDVGEPFPGCVLLDGDQLGGCLSDRQPPAWSVVLEIVVDQHVVVVVVAV